MEQSISTLSIVCAALSLAAAVGLPIALTIWCARRRKGMLRAVLIGALCFVLGALVLEQLLHLLMMTLVPNLQQMPFLFTVYTALAAGFFEETARLVGLRVLCKKDPDVMTGFAYGVGHGGIEAVVIGIVGLSGNLVTLLMMKSGQTASMLSGLTGDQLAAAQQQLDALLAAPPLDFLQGGVERVMTVCLHIALSMLIWMVVTHRLPKWGYLVAVGLHAGIDVFAALYQAGVLHSVWAIEALIALYTAVVCAGGVPYIESQNDRITGKGRRTKCAAANFYLLLARSASSTAITVRVRARAAASAAVSRSAAMRANSSNSYTIRCFSALGQTVGGSSCRPQAMMLHTSGKALLPPRMTSRPCGPCKNAPFSVLESLLASAAAVKPS